MNESLGKAATLGFALTFLLLIASAGVTYHNTRRILDNDRLVTHTREVLNGFADVLATVTEAETGQRGYLLTGQPDYLEPFEKARARADRQIAWLKELIAEDPGQQPRLTELEQHVHLRFDQLERNIALQKQRGSGAAQEAIRSGEGRKEMRALRALVDGLEEQEGGLLEERAAESRRSAAEAIGTGLLTTAVALLLIGVVYYLSRRNARDRLKAARRRHEQAERFRVTLASIGDAVIVTDPEGRVTFLNDVAQKLTGWGEEEARGKDFKEVFRVVHASNRRGNNAAEQALREGRVARLPDQTVLIGRDGTERPIADSVAPIRAGGGPVLGAVLVFRDVTERRRAEEALREADRHKDEFLATLAHELRNPLAPLRNAAAVLRLRGDEDPQMAWSRDVIDRQVEHLARLVDDLLDVSRIARGKLQLRKGPVDLGTVVERAAESSRPLIDARHHRLEMKRPEGAVWVEGDPTRLAQVLLNLLNNAAKYTPEGGRIEVALEKGAGEAVLRVRDTGVGIPAEMLPKVFDLFMQVERTLDRAEGGLGIGLTLVRRLVGLHHGTVEAHSEGTGRGSEFAVRLPLLPRPPAAGTGGTGAAAANRPAAALRILVVDDNADAADSLVVLLGMMGYDVRMATTGPAALAEAEAFRPDVVLLDIGLPGMSGYEVARRLQAALWFGRTVLVAMTGYGSAGDRRRSEETGFAKHLVKPVDVPTLQALLASLAKTNRV